MSPAKQLTLKRYFPWFFLYSVACPMAFPITPAIIAGLGVPDYMFGITYATMNFFSFLMSPVWGRLSDRFGRGRILTATVVGAAMGQLIFCFCTNAPTLVLARAVTGCFSGGHVINSMSYFAEIGGAEHRRRNLAVHVVSSALFSAVGYLVGGLLGNVSFKLTFGVQIGLLLFCGATLLPLVGESPSQAKETTPGNATAPSKSTADLLTPLRVLLLLLAITVTVGTNLFDEAFNYYLSKNLSFLPSQIGGVRAVVGLLGLVGYFLISRRILRGNHLLRSQAVAYGCCIAALGVVVSSGTLPAFLTGAIVYFFCNSVANSILQVTVIGGAARGNLGTIAGFFQSAKTLGSVIGSLLSGFAYAVHSELPFFISLFVFALALLLIAFIARVSGKADAESQ